MLETSARLLRLLSLLQSRSYWAGSELAEQLSVTERTVRRDVDKLRSLGYPVGSSSGVAGGYQLGSGAELPPLLLDDDEALAVVLGLRTASTGGVSGLEEAALRALTKLEQVLPARLRRSVKAFQASVSPLYSPRGKSAVSPRVLTQVARASRDQTRLRFSYEATDGQRTQRHVEPHGVVHTGARWYLVAYDLTREDWRTFRMDRVGAKLKVGHRFFRREVPTGSAASYVSRSVAVAAYPYQAKVVLEVPLETMQQRLGSTWGQLSALDDERCLLETGASDLTALALYIALLDVEFAVQEPPELVEALKVAAGRLNRARRRSLKD